MQELGKPIKNKILPRLLSYAAKANTHKSLGITLLSKKFGSLHWAIIMCNNPAIKSR